MKPLPFGSAYQVVLVLRSGDFLGGLFFIHIRRRVDFSLFLYQFAFYIHGETLQTASLTPSCSFVSWPGGVRGSDGEQAIAAAAAAGAMQGNRAPHLLHNLLLHCKPSTAPKTSPLPVQPAPYQYDQPLTSTTSPSPIHTLSLCTHG